MKILLFNILLCLANAFIHSPSIRSYTKIASSINEPSFLHPVPVNIYSRIFDKNKNLDEIQVFEPYGVDKNKTQCLLFFTGVTSVITYDVYSNVLNSIASKNVAVYIPKFKYNNIDKLIKTLSEEYNEIIPISHSSGVNSIVEKCSKHKSINKMILLDPVDSRILKNNKLKMKFIKNILFVIATKSYNGNPTFIPSFFSLNEDSFHLNRDLNSKTIESEEHGHCDILNPVYSNLMYNSKICDGVDDRKPSSLNKYHKWIANNINNFVKGDKLGDDSLSESSSKDETDTL